MMTDTTVPTPTPSVFVLYRLVIQIARVDLPVSLHNDPAVSTPSLENALSVLVVPNFALLAPEPTPRLVVMIFLPQVPIRTDFAPTVKVSTTVQVLTNTLVPTPLPRSSLRLQGSSSLAGLGESNPTT